MFDAKRLLDQILAGQGGRGGGLGGALGGALGGGSGGSAGGLGGVLGSVLGGNLGGGAVGRDGPGRTSGGGGLGGGLGDVLGGLSNSQVLGAGGLAAILLGSKAGRGMGSSALKLGGLAAVGALAYKAYQDWQAGQQPGASAASAPTLPAPSGTPFNPTSEGDQQTLGRKLLRAMIAAAKADGNVDASEQAAIFGEMDKLDLDADDKAFVVDELRAPLDVDAVARSASTPEEASEIYAASLLAIDVDSPAESGYLSMLAARLKLDDALVKHLHATIEGASDAAATPANQA